MKEFTNKDLKKGDIITLRNGATGFYDDEDTCIYGLDFNAINDDLTNNGCMGNKLDIVKVERYKQLDLATITTHNELILNTNKAYLKEVVYERKEILDEEEKDIEPLNKEFFWNEDYELSEKNYQENGRRTVEQLQDISDKVDELVKAVNELKKEGK